MDNLKLNLSSAGNCARIYSEVPDPVALENLIENATSAIVLARELMRRRDGDAQAFVPAPDPHLQELLDKFQARHSGAIPPGAAAASGFQNP
jgi:hypothetical protein